MQAYKATINMKRKSLTYEVGKTYEINRDIKEEKSGFRFFKKIQDVEKHYNLSDQNIIVIEIKVSKKNIVKEKGNELVASKIKVVRAIPREEYPISSNVSDDEFISDKVKIIKVENWDGSWEKREYDKNNNLIKYENSYGYCQTWKYDKNDNIIKEEGSNGYWTKYKYHKNKNKIKKWVISSGEDTIIKYETSPYKYKVSKKKTVDIVTT